MKKKSVLEIMQEQKVKRIALQKQAFLRKLFLEGCKKNIKMK